MRLERRLLLLTAGLALVLAVWLVVSLALVWFTLEPAQQRDVADLLGPSWVLFSLCWLLALISVAVGLRHWLRRFAGSPGRLLDETRVLLTAETPQRMSAGLLAPGELGSPEATQLAISINALAAQRDHLRDSVAEQVAQASRRLQQEKNQLAALMAELAQSVVVCNRDGRILFYNRRARLQFQVMSKSADLAGGAELIGIGRSIYAVLDRPLVTHALEAIHQRMARGAASPSTQFVTTTAAGQLLRVQMTPVRSGEPLDSATQAGPADTEPGSRLSGFVLMLDNITRSFEEAVLRDQLLQEHTEGSHSALSHMQVAIERLSLAGAEPSLREGALAALRDELAGMSERITALAQRATQGLKTRWPMEDMLGADLVSAAQLHMKRHCQLSLVTEAVDGALWLKADSYALIQVLSHLASRLGDAFAVRSLQLRLAPADGWAQLDLVWAGQAVNTETVMGWESEPMHFGDQRTPLTVRDVVARHGGQMWFERERVRQEAFFRFLLPLASSLDPLASTELLPTDSRPEYYDFDLFQHNEQADALDERLLSELSYTVFDTETTGLNPTGGDEIIQIGAARIVNGKLLRHEVFDHLVDPGRAVPAASILIHGITQEMLSGKPRIGEVLPAFHAFAQDTVLVAHNAAFDMRFLQLKEAATGLVFQHPVLDTLLLSAVVHPNQSSHRLEAIAERLNVTQRGRHTALGDAMATAEVWLRLIPLLQQMGITTLKQAREAAQKTYYARLKY
jgi:DNA polymerase-3 subunit epsilon